ncbi:hypothetical protein L9F63_002729, partial [Diploptera punctata]
ETEVDNQEDTWTQVGRRKIKIRHNSREHGLMDEVVDRFVIDLQETDSENEVCEEAAADCLLDMEEVWTYIILATDF